MEVICLQGYIIILTSLTYVNKAKCILYENKIRASVVKIRPKSNNKGCGYGIQITKNCLSSVISMLEKYKIKIVEVFEDND